MNTLEEFRRKIDTASDLGSVVTTMKTLAAVSIRQYERAVDALVDYNRTIEMGFQIVLHHQSSTLERPAKHGRTGAIVFGTDQGMCGQFNEQIVSYFVEHQRAEQPDPPWLAIAVGARAEGQLTDAGIAIDRVCQVPTSASDITNLVFELLPRIHRWQAEENVTKLVVFHNHRTSAAACAPRSHALLPIDPSLLRRWRQDRWQSTSLPTFAMDRRELLSRLVRQYLFVSMFRACAESLASENASRIAAMQLAEKNIEDHLEELQRSFHHLRQTAITEELQDVTTGFEALSQQLARPVDETGGSRGY